MGNQCRLVKKIRTRKLYSHSYTRLIAAWASHFSLERKVTKSSRPSNASLRHSFLS